MMQQFIGTLNLSIPIIVIYHLYPAMLNTYWGIFLCALVVGITTYLLNKRATDTMIRNLTYRPSGEWKSQFEQMIVQCGMDPKHTALVYAYTNEQTILTAYNTIIIDPLVWSSIASDPAAITVAMIFEQYTNPTLSAVQKQRLAEIKRIFYPDAQAFFFKRQLAHVYHHFSTKKLFVIGFVGTLAAYVSILIAMAIVPVNGMLAIVVGIVVGCITDLIFTYISNALFKLPEEKAADLFAAHHSSCAEIEAAATFFEQHHIIKNRLKDPNNFLSFLPSVLATGHLSSSARARYLRDMAAEKGAQR